ncbi:MAG TPA: ROK family protein [Ktedonobacteraceae bacterium]|nr:ROK family protein [Ktedonobacteraceae bacterium]
MNEEHSGNTSIATEDLPLVVGVDLGGTQMRTAVLRGTHLLSRVGSLTGENPTPERMIPRTMRAIEQALDQAGVSLDQIAGIGVAMPGPINSYTGVVYSPPNLPGWDNVPLRDIFNQQFNIPVFVENDANTAALGEYIFGAGRGTKNMVYMTISTGIGGGIIIDGKIMEGASGMGGELGHMTVDWRGERCTCGNIGCLERIASGTAIALRANELIAQGKGADLLTFAVSHAEHSPADTSPDHAAQSPLHISARTVALAAAAGIPTAQEIIARAAEALGVGLVNIIHIFNPEMIILGGGLTQMGPLLLDPAKRLVQERTMHVPFKAVRIVLAQLGHDVGLVGAGALIYYQYSLRRAA